MSVVAGTAEMWALSVDDAAVYPVGPTPGVLGSPVYSPVTGPSEMVLVGADMWVLGGKGGLSPVNVALGRIVQTGVSLPGRSLGGLSGSGGALWLGEPGRAELVRLDVNNVSAREFAAPDGLRPSSTAVGRCGVWVAEGSGKLALINPATDVAIGPAIKVGRSIASLAPSGTGVWAERSSRRDGRLRRRSPGLLTRAGDPQTVVHLRGGPAPGPTFGQRDSGLCDALA